MSFYVVQFLTGLASASSLFLVAAGLSLIFGVTRIINLAHGSFYMLGAYIAHTLVTALGTGVVGYVAAIVGGAIAVGLLGIATEVLLLRRIYRAPELLNNVAAHQRIEFALEGGGTGQCRGGGWGDGGGDGPGGASGPRRVPDRVSGKVGSHPRRGAATPARRTVW